MAPELLKGKTRFNSDIFQLGLIIFHLISGVPAINASDGDEKVALSSGVPQSKALHLNSPFRSVPLCSSLIFFANLQVNDLTLNFTAYDLCRNCLARMLEVDPLKRYNNEYDIWRDLSAIQLH